MSTDTGNQLLERFFPEEKTTEIFDTLLVVSGVQLTITKKYLDTYVRRAYETNSGKIIDKYRDAILRLTIRQNNIVLLDTTIIKEQIVSADDTGFTDNAVFHNYWCQQSNKDSLIFFGVITVPETDDALDFQHIYDIKNKVLIFRKIENPESN